MKRLYILAFCWSAALPVFPQAANCTQVLRLIRTTYEQGRLHELPGIAEGCLRETGAQVFTKEERKEAYRYLTLSYIYLEEPEKADAMMLQLLNTDHFYQPNAEVDPAEFIALFNKFRTTPLYRLGATIGLNGTLPMIMKNYYVGSESAGHGKYSVSLAVSAYASFEKDITDDIVLAPEIGYISRAYNYTNNDINVLDSLAPNKSPISQTFAVSQSWLDLNVIGQYKFNNTVQFQTYAGIGPGVSMLLGSENLPNTLLSNGFTVTGPVEDDTNCYTKFVYSVIVVAGLKYKIGELYATANLRYQFGFTNAINEATRTNTEIAYAYQGAYNDHRISNLTINLGIVYPIFKPKKMIN